MNIHQMTEADLRAKALDHECPTCGAAPKVRCRILTRTDRGPGYPINTKADVRKKPCDGRVMAAWRDMLSRS